MRNLALVWTGGALGTAARAALGLVLPSGWVALPTLVVNVVGAFCLGALYATLDRRAASGRAHPELRLLWGTGMLGGFTTYSALSVAAASAGAAGLAYALVSVLSGLAACALGVGAAGLGRSRPVHAKARG